VMVVHDLSGARVACGLIHKRKQSSPLLSVASFAPYPGYSGYLRVVGTVTIEGFPGTETTAKQKLSWSLLGLDTACTAGAATAKNGCGIHIHVGKSCEVADGVGGHHWSRALASDPWAPFVYVAAADGSSQQTAAVVTGLPNKDIMGRVMVVHDLSGARVACGLIQQSMAQPGDTCAGYGALHANTDITGVLLAKVQSQSSSECCTLCTERLECEGYVFHLDQCYLKKDLAEAETSFKQDAMMSMKLSGCLDFAQEMENTDVSGTLLAKIKSSDSKRCCMLCNAFTGCEGYVFHLDQCYLKKDLSSPSRKPGAITRMKYAVAPNNGAMLRGSA